MDWTVGEQDMDVLVAYGGRVQHEEGDEGEGTRGRLERFDGVPDHELGMGACACWFVTI